MRPDQVRCVSMAHHDVQMEVVDSLASLGPVVHHYAEPFLEALFRRVIR